MQNHSVYTLVGLRLRREISNSEQNRPSVMEKVLKQQIIERASANWICNEARQAGVIIFETIPVNRRRVWAYEILKLAYSHFPKDSRIDAVLEFAEYPEKWGEGKDSRLLREAHRIVDAVNRGYDYPIISHLATQAGKIVYTAQQYPAPLITVQDGKLLKFSSKSFNS